MQELEICDRNEFAIFVNSHKELEAKPFEANSVSSMMYVNSDDMTIAQAIYYRSGKPIYKIRRDYNAGN